MIKNSLFIAFFGMIGFLHAETLPVEPKEDHLISKLIENRQYCVSAFDGDKIFIRPENIVATDQWLFINLDGFQLYPLPLLQFDNNGYFLEGNLIGGLELAASKHTRGPCPACDIPTDGNGICRNPLCLFCGFKVL
jgi:hypothetical protein